MILGGPEGQEDFTIIGDEDELDAFNDETFGSADQWQESEHENLAKLTEQERSALQASNDFFDFGSGDDEGESLEPEPNQNGGSDDGAGGDLPQLSKLNLEQGVQAPLTIQTQTGLPVNPMVYPQVVPVPYHLPQQQVPFNLVPPAHFQAQVQSGPGESLQDPAIMSVIKVPQGPMVINPQHYQQVQMHRGTFPGGLPPAPVQNFPQNANTFPGGTIIQDPNSEFRRAPPTVLGYKTMQDVENEMLYGNRNHQHQHQQQQMQQHQLPMNQAFQQQQQHGFNQSRQHQMNQHQQVPLQRNLNYPGMRDRQQQQVR